MPCGAQQPTFRDALLDRFAGRWVLIGTIAGKPTTHYVTAEWVLGHQYLRVHEVARALGADGQPAYQADVYVGRDPKTREYTCVWLDNTPGGVDAHSLGRAPAGTAGDATGGDSVAFLFRYDDGSRMHTTFVYDRAADRWAWRLDAEPAGKSDLRRPFARVTLTRVTAPPAGAASAAPR
ncbi:hypothetical protein tb265_24880 [Gemmatimonadetes bacterium T265]|nr:hypothetical protein tb265_24880 [Gemmatimonadetes bacterium T265]